MGACNVQEERVGEEFQTARGGYWPYTRKCCVSTHRSLLRRQLDVSGRPPSPPSRCHISTILWDLSSCLRSSSTRSLHQPSVSLNELSLNKLRGLNIALLGRVFLRPLWCLKIVLRNKINRQLSRYLKLTNKNKSVNIGLSDRDHHLTCYAGANTLLCTGRAWNEPNDGRIPSLNVTVEGGGGGSRRDATALTHSRCHWTLLRIRLVDGASVSAAPPTHGGGFAFVSMCVRYPVRSLTPHCD